MDLICELLKNKRSFIRDFKAISLQALIQRLIIIWMLLISYPSLANDIWKSNGYGYVIDLTILTKPLVYDITDDFCLLNHFITTEMQEDGVSIDREKGLLEFRALFPLVVRKIDTLPKECSANGLINYQNENYIFNASDVLNVLLSNFSSHYAFTAHRKINWALVNSRWMTRVDANTTPDQLLQVIDDFLKYMRDGHAILLDESLNRRAYYPPRDISSEQRIQSYFSQKSEYSNISQANRFIYKNWIRIISSYFKDDYRTEEFYNNFLFAKLKAGYSYLRVESFDDFAKDDLAAIVQVMNKLTPQIITSKGLIIDLRDSSGGSDLISLKLVSFLVEKKLKIGEKRYMTPEGLSQSNEIYITPSTILPYLGKIVILTSQHTPSAAEVFLISLKARGNVSVIGENSFGALSDALTKALPNGWGITLSNEIYTDHLGINYEMTGIPVESHFDYPNISDIENDKDSALEFAIALLKVN